MSPGSLQVLLTVLVPAGTASGYLLGKFCPNDGVNCGEATPGSQIPGYQCRGHVLWLIITLLTCMSPFGILLFQVRLVGPTLHSSRSRTLRHTQTGCMCSIEISQSPHHLLLSPLAVCIARSECGSTGIPVASTSCISQQEFRVTCLCLNL